MAVEEEIRNSYIVEKTKLVEQITEIRSMISASNSREVSPRSSQPGHTDSNGAGNTDGETLVMPGQTPGKSGGKSKKDKKDSGKKDKKEHTLKRSGSVRNQLRDRMKALRNADDAYDTEIKIARLNRRYSSKSLLQTTQSGNAPVSGGGGGDVEMSPSTLAKNFRPGRIRNMKPPGGSRSNLADIYDGESQSDSDDFYEPLRASGGFCCFGGGGSKQKERERRSNRVVSFDG
jgi:hypothetical protein